jgi:hypothetical protein
MTPIRVYIGLENIALTAPQKATVVAALRGLGKQSDNQPSHINHMRVRLDNNAAIFEAEFDDSELTIANFKQLLANAFGVAVGTITNANTTNAYGLVVTLAQAGTDRMRALLFGGAGATLAASRAAVQAYLAANAAAWKPAP